MNDVIQLLTHLALGALGGWSVVTIHHQWNKRKAKQSVPASAPPTVVNSSGVRIVFFEIEYHVPDEWSDEKAVQQTMMFCSVLLDAYEHRDEEQHYYRAAQVRDFMRGCPTYLPNARANYRHMQQQMQKRQQP